MGDNRMEKVMKDHDIVMISGAYLKSLLKSAQYEIDLRKLLMSTDGRLNSAERQHQINRIEEVRHIIAMLSFDDTNPS